MPDKTLGSSVGSVFIGSKSRSLVKDCSKLSCQSDIAQLTCEKKGLDREIHKERLVSCSTNEENGKHLHC